METATFLRTLKSIRTRYTKNPNEEKMKAALDSIIAKMGGDVLAIVAIGDDEDLRQWFLIAAHISNEDRDEARKIVEGKSALTTEDTPKVEDTETKETPKEETKSETTPAEKKSKKLSKEERYQVCTTKNGDVVRVDNVKKTCKKIYKSFADLDPDELDLDSMSMQVYQRYLKDKFPNEEAVVKGGKLKFRRYRIYCDVENGFVIEDMDNKYKQIDTPFEGIPTPRELGEFFTKPERVFTQEELKRASEWDRQEKERVRAESKERLNKEVEEVDLEKCRRAVLLQIKEIRAKKGGDFDPMKFSDMIPFRAWKRKCNQLLKAWQYKEIRYAKFINELEEFTETISFEDKAKLKRNPFVGTPLPSFKTIGLLRGDKIEVDGKEIDAVPFMTNYILFYEPKAMPQLMKYAAGEVSDIHLLTNPIVKDGTIEFKKGALDNTIENARLLTAFCESLGLVAPQDMLFTDELKVGDKILIAIDGEWKTRTIMSTEEGVCISKGVGVTKFDKWIKLPKKEVAE